MDTTWNFIFLFFFDIFKKLLVMGKIWVTSVWGDKEWHQRSLWSSKNQSEKNVGYVRLYSELLLAKYCLLLIMKRMKEEKTQNIFKHRTVILLSFCFCYFSPRSLLIRHWTYFWQPAEDGIIAYLLVQFNPGEVASTVGILKSKEPHLPESNGFDSLVE